MIVYTSKQSKNDFVVQLITTHKQVQELINQFEPNIKLQRKGLLSLDGIYYLQNNIVLLFNLLLLGFRNMMLSDDFSLMKPWCSRRSSHDMTK